MEEGVFSRGYSPPPLSQCHRPRPPPQNGGNTQLSTAIRSPQTPQLCSRSKRLRFLGTTDRQAGASPPSQPPFPKGMRCQMLAGGCRMPPAPCPPALPPLLSGGGTEQSRFPLPPEVQPCEHVRWERLPPPPHLQLYLEFLSRPKCETTFFSFYNPNARLKKPTHFLPFLVKGV